MGVVSCGFHCETMWCITLWTVIQLAWPLPGVDGEGRNLRYPQLELFSLKARLQAGINLSSSFMSLVLMTNYSRIPSLVRSTCEGNTVDWPCSSHLTICGQQIVACNVSAIFHVCGDSATEGGTAHSMDIIIIIIILKFAWNYPPHHTHHILEVGLHGIHNWGRGMAVT